MTLVYVFPGQGSQFKGMGKELFDQYTDLVQQANEQLGYSIKDLCLEDPNSVLNKTEYTQPALYVVNALCYLKKRESEIREPEYLAGHSLGEFNALFAAGAFDFITGLKIVQKRGLLMSQAPKGAMAAIMGIDKEKIQEILRNNALERIDIANLNSVHQTIISGLYDDICRCEEIFIQAGALYARLNVSAAFHSRYMKSVQDEFEAFIKNIEFAPLKYDVVSNYNARPYPKHDYLDFMIKQITCPVKWYETVSWLLKKENPEVEEIGPGNVLTKLYFKIKEEPLKLEDKQSIPEVKSGATPSPNKRPQNKYIFMYSGQGSQYYHMGKELYENNQVFKENMNQCDSILQSLIGMPLVEDLYSSANKHKIYDDLLLTHPALFCFGYSLTRVLIDKGINPDAVLGYSLGEYVAATVAGAISLEDGINIVVQQAKYIKENSTGGAMLTVLADIQTYDELTNLFSKCSLAGVNYRQNFVLSGRREDLIEVKEQLDELSIISLFLPVHHGFHSDEIDSIENNFKQSLTDVSMQLPKIPIFSCVRTGEISGMNAEYLWDVVREEVNFSKLIQFLIAEQSYKNYRFLDLSPTGTLSGFIKREFDNEIQHHFSINQFGRNIQTINDLLDEVSI